MSFSVINVKDVKYNARVVNRQFTQMNKKHIIAYSYCKTQSIVTLKMKKMHLLIILILSMIQEYSQIYKHLG